jgi:hypothetical protein
MTGKMNDTVFNLGSCSTANSYYFNQHGEAAILRPSSAIGARREVETFPLSDYAFASASY